VCVALRMGWGFVGVGSIIMDVRLRRRKVGPGTSSLCYHLAHPGDGIKGGLEGVGSWAGGVACMEGHTHMRAHTHTHTRTHTHTHAHTHTHTHTCTHTRTNAVPVMMEHFLSTSGYGVPTPHPSHPQVPDNPCFPGQRALHLADHGEPCSRPASPAPRAQRRHSS